MRRKLIVFLGTFVFGFLIANVVLLSFNSNIQDRENIDNKDSKIIRPSLEVSPIYINDVDPLNNWETFNATHSWCNGAGTKNNPYVIDDVSINGDGTYICIEIENSEVYFMVQNSDFHHAGSTWQNPGIKLQNVTNGRFENNQFNNNAWALHANISDYNFFIGNTFTGNIMGLLLEHSHNNIIINNDAISNTRYGIYLLASDSNTVLGNTADDNDIGINIEWDSNYNNITNNLASNNREIGIQIYHNHDNIAKENTVINNIQGIAVVGPMSYDSHDNLVFNNTFITNGINGIDTGEDNLWYNDTLGNFWDDYVGTDIDDDGIGDTPYNVDGTAGSIDPYPIFEDGDDSPEINVNLPIPDTFFGVASPNFNVEILDDHFNKSWYTLNDGIIKLFNQNESIDQGMWGALGDGPISIQFFANNTFGNIRSSEVIVVKDTTNPAIIINSPAPNSIFGNNAPNFVISVTELNLNLMWYSLDQGSTTYTFTELTGSINQLEWDLFSEGEITLRFYANDKFGNTNYEEVTIIKQISSSNGGGGSGSGGGSGATGESVIPLGNYYLIIIIISILFLIAVKKRKLTVS